MNSVDVVSWKNALSRLTDEILLDRTRLQARSERARTAWLVAYLAEVFRRELALKRGFPSLYEYARKELRLSDMMAYERVSAARLALQLPETIEKLASGELTLSAACELWKAIRDEEKPTRATDMRAVIQPGLVLESNPKPGSLHSDSKPLRSEEKRELFSKVLGKTKRESQAVLQDWKHERVGNAQPPKLCSTEVIFPLNDEELAQFDRLRDLLSHKLGFRERKAAFLWMLEQGLDRIDPVRKHERVARREAGRATEFSAEKGMEERIENSVTDGVPGEAPHKCSKGTVQQGKAAEAGTLKSTSKRKPIPASLKRRIWIRDQGQCQFRGGNSDQICGATAFLDLDHVRPVSEGGENSDANLRLACAAHNRRRHHWGEG